MSENKNDDLPAELIRLLFHYDQASGLFYSRRYKPRVRVLTKPLGKVDSSGRIQIRVLGATYSAHRLAWLYMHGAWPQHHIDHINGEPLDNRIANLRDVPRSINNHNIRKATSLSKTGILGVSKLRDRWVSRINLGGKLKHLGVFDTSEEAHEAYLRVKRANHEGFML